MGRQRHTALINNPFSVCIYTALRLCFTVGCHDASSNTLFWYKKQKKEKRRDNTCKNMNCKCVVPTGQRGVSSERVKALFGDVTSPFTLQPAVTALSGSETRLNSSELPLVAADDVLIDNKLQSL